MLPESCRRIDSRGDAALAEVLRDSGYSVVADGSVDAVLFDTADVPDRDDVARAAAAVSNGGVVAIAVGGGEQASPKSVALGVRLLQLMLSPLETARALAGARRARRALVCAGLDISRLATGDRSRSRYGLGPGGWVRRARTPVGFVVAGSKGSPSPSVYDAAVERAGKGAGIALRRRRMTVFESGKVIVGLSGPGRECYCMRLAAGPAEQPLRASLDAVAAVAGAGAGAAVRERLLLPLARGNVGPVHYALEPCARGGHPWRMTDSLWDDCLEFLLELASLEPGEAEVRREPSFAAQAARLMEHLGEGEQEALGAVLPRLESGLGDVPRGFSHGDFWSENLFVRRGRLATVLDWEWAARDSLPVLDLFDLIASSRRRVRDFPPGERFTAVLWPLAQAGGSDRLRAFCRALGVSSDPATLEALAVAYWLARVTRQLTPLSPLYAREGWLENNVHGPLRRLEAAGWG